MNNKKDDLHERVELFHALALPGQPMMMHMGTGYLVSDLWQEVNRLRDRLAAETRRCDELFAENQTLRRTRPATVWMGDP